MTASGSVLVVSDGASELAACRKMLESSGFSVFTASSPDDALEAFQSRPTGAVVVDASVLAGKGQDFASSIKQLRPRVPVIVLGEYRALARQMDNLIDAIVLKAQESQLLSARLASLIKIRSHSHPQLEGQYVVFADSDRRYLDCSDGVCELLGYARRELLGLTIDDVSYRPEKTSVLFEQYMQQGALDGQYILRHKSGKPVFIRYHSHMFPDGCMGAVWHPIEDWKQLYQSAMLEFDRNKLAERLDLAYAAVNERLRQISTDKARSPEEWQQLNDAISGLRVLKREVPA